MRILQEKPTPGWTFPCSVADVGGVLRQLEADHLQGLDAVILKSATKKDHGADARYFAHGRPRIEVYSYFEHLEIKLKGHRTQRQAREFYRDAIRFGLEIVSEPGLNVARWQPEHWRNFVLCHVLPHEVGHHVFWKQNGLSAYESLRHESEQFATAFARRMESRIRVTEAHSSDSGSQSRLPPFDG